MNQHSDDLPPSGIRDTLFRHADRDSALGFWSLDHATGALWLSPRARTLLGGSHAPSDRASLIERVHGEDRRSFESMLRDAEQRENACELRFESGENAWVSLHATATPTTDASTTTAGTLTDAANGPFVTAALRAVVAGTGAKHGDDLFRALVLHLAAACGTKFAFLADFTDARRTRVRSFALAVDGQIAPNIEYDLVNTPCEHVANAVVCIHPRDVQRLYPDDRLLVEMGIESYLGVPLFASSGEPMGILVVLHDRAIEHAHDLRTLLSIFAARAAAEKERMRIEAARSEMEVRVHRAEKLESLGLLAGGIAHDFSNYLTAMLGHLELVNIALDDDRSPRKNLDAMAVGLRQATELTKQLLAYAGKGSRVAVDVDLNRVIEEISILFRGSLPATVRLESDLATTSTQIHGDPAQIQQIVMNLVTNGVDALTDATGSVVLRTRRARLDDLALDTMDMRDGAEPGEYVLLEATDTGRGMEPEAMKHAFEPFFTTKSVGRGLGLSSLLGIVRGHRGAVSVASTPGAGTTFRVYFPTQPPSM